MAKSNYWNDRKALQRVRYGDMAHKKIRRAYYKEYKRMLLEVENLMGNLYDKITTEGHVPSANELYKYNRYYEMHKELEKIVSNYGNMWYRLVNTEFKKLYIENCQKIMTDYNLKHIDEAAIQKTAKELWNAKGRHWSKTVWCKGDKDLTALDRRKNGLQKMQTTLERGLLDCVGRGRPKDELVKEIRDRCNVDWHESDRLVRTELTYVQNQSTLDGYQAQGIDEYRYFAHIDDRTSEICHSLNNKIFKVSKAEVGLNYPPMHPNCRSTTVPVVNNYAPKSKSYEENAARKYKNRKKYYEGVKKHNPKSKVKHPDEYYKKP